MRIYDRRSFRFCFSNQQMAHAVTDFIWSRDELRPDSDPVYTVSWEDDPYSTDLVNNGFYTALRTKAAVASAQDLAWLTGGLAHGSFPLTLNGLSYTRFALSAPTFK